MFAVMKVAGYTAPEADDFRKAIAKKLKDKVEFHRKKFIKGAVNLGISEKMAGEIYSDWEEFARYGFNKSHAVDYGVIAVQTAHLKAHYPVEYMTALLSVVKNDTGKVALYVADCRRMGIPVEPPNINVSDWDFSIEDCEDGSSVIRFGLGAVKNVGQAPVEAILKARNERKFSDLNDFARRVDLRLVGKRALESLVKVGALDQFGSRTSILEILDRIIGISSSHFRAAEAGQLSMFGAHTGVEEDIVLPFVTFEVSQREILNWERELIGLYITDHPLNPVMDILNDLVTHFSGQLSEVPPDERVRIAGLITQLRTHQTKTGNMMAFATLEDLQGMIELIIFPSVWSRVSATFEMDKIVVIDGRVDNTSGNPKIKVEQINTEISSLAPLERKKLSVPINAIAESGNQNHWVRKSIDFEPELEQVIHFTDDLPDDLTSNQSGIPEIIDTTIIEINSLDELSHQQDRLEAPSSLQDNPELVYEPPIVREYEPVVASPTSLLNASQQTTIPNPPDPQSSVETLAQSVTLPPYIISPRPSDEEEKSIKMVTIILRSTGDQTRDVLRLHRIYGILTSYPGKDRFAFHVFERGRGYLVEFPNSLAGLCPELIERLNNLVGSENIRLETITFQ